MSLKCAMIAAAFIAIPAAAFAAPSPITITLAAPLAKSEKVVAGNGVFACAETACVSVSDVSVIEDRAACTTIAKTFGAVASVTGSKATFDEARLAKCNASAKK